MKEIFVLALLLLPVALPAQEAEFVSTFHRLLVFNANNEMLVVRFEGTDRWVTPGWYQDACAQSGKDWMHSRQVTRLEIAPPILHGVFSLKDDSGRFISTRLVHTTHTKGGEARAPEGIGEVRWLPIEEAISTITFSHVRDRRGADAARGGR